MDPATLRQAADLLEEQKTPDGATVWSTSPQNDAELLRRKADEIERGQAPAARERGRGWNSREDVSEELEADGWAPDGEFPGLKWRKGDAVWQIVFADGSSAVENTRERYIVPFGPRVPAHLVVAACREAAAECQEHGSGCDHHAPDGIYNGEIR